MNKQKQLRSLMLDLFKRSRSIVFGLDRELLWFDGFIIIIYIQHSYVHNSERSDFLKSKYM